MKKFSKILVLLLSLIAIVTAFTVVALAAEEATEKSEPHVPLSLDFQDKEVGVIQDDTTKPGKWSIYAADYGPNKYLVSEYGPNTVTSLDQLTYDFGTKSYNIGSYPTFAFDFDIMSTTGNFDSTWGDSYFKFAIYYSNNSSAGSITATNFTKLEDLGAFSDVPYEWHHVTITITYVTHADGNYFETRYFVNGQEITDAAHQNTLSALSSAPNQGRVRLVYITPFQDGPENVDKLGFDNLKFSYYKADYSIEEVVNYVYNYGKYELPYGKTVASIVEGEVENKYDNFEEAYAAANKNNVLKLYANATCTIDKPMTVDANGYTLNWTSDIYVDANADASIYEFQKKPPVVLEYTNTADSSTTNVIDFSNVADEVQNGEKLGKWTVYTSDDGNRYLVGEYDDYTNKDRDRLDLSVASMGALGFSGVDTKGYSINKYPTFAFDFDIMSPTGSYNGNWDKGGMQARFYVNNGIAGTTTNTGFDKFGFSDVPYQWQHVTLVITYVGEAKFVSRYFVNGVEITELSVTNDFSDATTNKYAANIYNPETGVYTEAGVRAQYIYITPTADYDQNAKVAMDNFRCTYYPKGYDAQEVATYVYNASYELPESGVVASIVSGNSELKFDSFAKAYAAANEKNTLKLYKDATCVIDKAINVDANNYNFNVTANGFVDVNADANVYELRHAGEVYLTDVWFNLSYYSNFKYNLYLPANDTLKINSVSWGEGAEVYMNETKYFVYSFEATTTGAADITEVTVNYTADGNTYTQTYELSALVYAGLALGDSEDALEIAAVSNMARYIKEARAQAGIEDTNDYTDLIAGATEYQESYDDLGASYAVLNGAKISLALNGTNVAYAIDVTAFADATVTAKLGDTEIAVAKSGDFWFTESAKVYDIVGNLITITVHTAEGDRVGTYSVGAYIKESDNTLAKAMYEFGVAAKAYRESITG